ncbi:hypothetical protein AHAS_Ahas01G0095300 [Arachis hypogaea]
MAGFMMNIGKVTITKAELWAIYTGLKIVFDMGMEKVQVETDSTCAVNLLQHASTDLHDSTSLIRAIKELQANPGDFRVNHVLREANFSADVLAKHAHNLPAGLHHFVSPPSFLVPTIEVDRRQIVFARIVNA